MYFKILLFLGFGHLMDDEEEVLQSFVPRQVWLFS